MRLINLAQKVIKFSFYALFALVPLVLWRDTSELFEFNKMWVTFVLVILIGASWSVKSILTKKLYIQRTPLDIPIALFLLSQFISTIVSLDTHISIWGYYSRFNGGLLSIVSYVFLYYAFLSNFSKDELLRMVKKILKLSLITGVIVALWGLPSHFGYDPTCLLFRGELNVSCWTEDFQPRVRIFSTLGQPAWLGAYLAILIPLSIWFSMNEKRRLFALAYLMLAVLFYVDVLYTKSRAAFIAVWISLVSLILINYGSELKKFNLFKNDIPTVGFIREFLGLIYITLKNKYITLIITLFLFLTFLVGAPFEQLRSFSLDGIREQPETAEQTTGTFSTGGGTDSGKIRLYVWQGAFEIFKNYPIFGTGVETYAFAYYKFRPVEHNLTSEWNFLYNKAHNEYLNYLATTGLVGLGSYLFMIGLFLWTAVRYVLLKRDFLITALIASYISILVTNFFGFSVVITNLYLFFIPAFVLVLGNFINYKNGTSFSFKLSPRFEKFGLGAVGIIALYFLFYLLNYWTGDMLYAFGSNLNRSGEYQQAYAYLRTAADRVPSEPTFKDELAQNSATLAVALSLEGSSEAARLSQQLAEEAVLTTAKLTSDHPNNMVFLKSQVRIYYTLSQIDDRYLSLAIDSVKKAQNLAPTDANISYNLGILYGQNKEYEKAVETLEKTIKLKPDYTNAYYALGLFYHQMATNERGQVIDFELQEKAIAQMRYIIENLDPQNQPAQEALETWQQELPSPEK